MRKKKKRAGVFCLHYGLAPRTTRNCDCSGGRSNSAGERKKKGRSTINGAVCRWQEGFLFSRTSFLFLRGVYISDGEVNDGREISAEGRLVIVYVGYVFSPSSFFFFPLLRQSDSRHWLVLSCQKFELLWYFDRSFLLKFHVCRILLFFWFLWIKVMEKYHLRDHIRR